MKLHNLVLFENLILVYQIFNKTCPVDLISNFSLEYLSETHNTRGRSLKFLAKPTVRTTKFGLNSIIYQSVLDWNKFVSLNHSIDPVSLSKRKFRKLALSYVSTCNTN